VSACDGPSTIMTDRILAAKVGQAFLPAGRPSSESLSSSAPAQTGMSAPHHAGQLLTGASGFVGGFFIEGEAGPCSSRRAGRADKMCDEA
jgi:hypothetical protein